MTALRTPAFDSKHVSGAWDTTNSGQADFILMPTHCRTDKDTPGRVPGTDSSQSHRYSHSCCDLPHRQRHARQSPRHRQQPKPQERNTFIVDLLSDVFKFGQWYDIPHWEKYLAALARMPGECQSLYHIGDGRVFGFVARCVASPPTRTPMSIHYDEAVAMLKERYVRSLLILELAFEPCQRRSCCVIIACVKEFLPSWHSFWLSRETVVETSDEGQSSCGEE